MDKKFKECMKPHMLAHTLTGFGLGLVVTNWLGALQGSTGTWLGVLLFVVGFVWDYSVNKG